MSDLVRVISACSCRAGLLPIYEKQLLEAGIGLYVSDIERGAPGHSLGYSVDFIKKSVDLHGNAEALVFTDAWDVLFYGTAREVYDKIPEGKVLMAAEKNCWPDIYLAGEFTGKTPWKYPNGGFLAGRPESFSRWIESIKSHPAYFHGFLNQQWYLHRYLDKSIELDLDTGTELVYCMYMDSGELQFDTRPFNTVTEARPNFIHFNGKVNPALFLYQAEQKTMALV